VGWVYWPGARYHYGAKVYAPDLVYTNEQNGTLSRKTWNPVGVLYGGYPWASVIAKKSKYDPVPSSDKQLENHIPHIGYGPTTPDWRGRIANLKRTRLRSSPHQSLIPSRQPRVGRISSPISPACLILKPQLGTHPGPGSHTWRFSSIR
jgi:hypothetical protein